MPLQIIGAGFGRTGTMSLKLALEQLGFGPCYHMIEVIQAPERAAAWLDASDGKSVSWDDVFEGYRATVDWPACSYWRELAEYYPQAKVLLSVREAAGWYKSVANTIHKVIANAPAEGRPEAVLSLVGLTRKLVFESTFGGRFEERDHAIDVFERHNQAVRDAIAPERLLVYEPGQGWEPLCDFFDVPVPETDYSHENSTESFTERFSKLRGEFG